MVQWVVATVSVACVLPPAHLFFLSKPPFSPSVNALFDYLTGALGYEVTTMQSDAKQSRTKAGYRRRSINGKVGLRVPRAVVTEKCKRYQQRGKPIHRTELLHESDYTIIATYQLEYRGIVNYYRHA